MGLTFHYSGTIQSYTFIDELTEEVKDICQNLDWNYTILKKEKNSNLKGIVILPQNSEPLFLTFLPDSRLCSPLSLMFDNDPANDPIYYYTIHTKTQFAGADIHITLLKLLRHLGNKYFAELHVEDEGLYWETQNESVLLKQFEKYNYALEMVTKALAGIEIIPGETTTSFIERLEKMLLTKLTRIHRRSNN